MSAASKGGIIWHTQGSGKSIVMVLLAKWILENNPRPASPSSPTATSWTSRSSACFRMRGTDPPHQQRPRSDGAAGQAKPRLLCSLVHKFGRKDVDDFDAFIKELESQPSPTVGEVFVFVDECHRTQSGKLHRVMKAMMPNAVFIGFTGTPLLKKDKQTSLEVFGGYIHTYKFSEAVEDGWCSTWCTRRATSTSGWVGGDKIDAWFEAKTKGLERLAEGELKSNGARCRTCSARGRAWIGW
jgi:type I restriction enzyme R subunit